MVILLNVSLCWMAYIVIIAVNFQCCYSASATYVGKAINSTSAATNPVLYGLLNASIRKFVLNRRSRRKQLSMVEIDIIMLHTKMGNKDSVR